MSLKTNTEQWKMHLKDAVSALTINSLCDVFLAECFTSKLSTSQCNFDYSKPFYDKSLFS